MKEVTIENSEATELFLRNPFIRLGPFARIVNSRLHGNNIIGQWSFFNRSEWGRYSGMGSFSQVSDTTVGRYCTFGSRVSVGGFAHPTDWLSIHEFQYRDTAQIYGESIIEPGVNLLRSMGPETFIGCDVWIGDNATVARGIKIGHGAIIGMSSVVTRDVEPYTIVVGNPARRLRKRFGEEMIEKLLDVQWWNLEISELAGFDFKNPELAIAAISARQLDGRRNGN